MPRLMSVAKTTGAVRARHKTVTRRLGWRFLKVGEPLTLCAKVQGRRKGEPLDRLAEVAVISVRRERLEQVTDADLVLEGFEYWDVFDWISWFCEEMRCTPQTEVTRIEWRYLDGV